MSDPIWLWPRRKPCTGRYKGLEGKGFDATGKGFEGGLIGFYATVAVQPQPDAQASDSWTVRFVQNCNTHREATYADGTTVFREFGFVRDVEPDSVALRAGQPTTVRLTDAPKWQWFDKDGKGPESVRVGDQFRVFLTVETPSGDQRALYCIDWTFRAENEASKYVIDSVTRLGGQDKSDLKTSGDFANDLAKDEFKG